MSPRIKISHLLVKRLEKLPNESSGCLFGVRDNETIFLLGLTLSSIKQSPTQEIDDVDLQKAINYDILANLPTGFALHGIFKVTDKEMPNNFDADLLNSPEESLVIIKFNGNLNEITAQVYKNGISEKSEFTIIDQNEIVKQFLHLRIAATFPVASDLQVSCVDAALNNLEKKIYAGDAGFQIEDSNVYILGEKPENISGISPKSTVQELCNVVTSPNKNKNLSEFAIVNVQIYLNHTAKDYSPQVAPYIKYIKKEFKHAIIEFSLDGLIIVGKSLSISNLYSKLVEGTLRNFNLNKKNLMQILNKNKILDICLPEPYHFLPASLGHFVSICYSPKQNPDELKKIREAFHVLLALPLDRPLFRQANAYDFNMTSHGAGFQLLNPHEKVGKSGVTDGEPCFVQGTYAYYHYMQDKFDDNGWGCAYRSLQTIFSWFRFQGYTTMSVPSHKEIQRCLVNIGDKPASFVGSRQWIGSTEVSFVLDTMLGITCRIVNISSGEEMTMKGGELSHHFKTQGTPIMIGGGVLAHTILGIDYNKKTGDMKFLILDPHYTGEEDLSVILKKGWCGWKGPEFWKKDAFYNMCLPLIPKCV